MDTQIYPDKSHLPQYLDLSYQAEERTPISHFSNASPHILQSKLFFITYFVNSLISHFITDFKIVC